MTKGLKSLLNEMLKELEREAIKAIVTAALANIKNEGESLKATLDADTQDLKGNASTYNRNITDGLEGQTAQVASDFLTQLPKPVLESPVN